MFVVERHLFQNREIVIAGDTIIEQLEHGHGRGATIQRMARQLLNAIRAEIPCDLGCPGGVNRQGIGAGDRVLGYDIYSL